MIQAAVNIFNNMVIFSDYCKVRTSATQFDLRVEFVFSFMTILNSHKHFQSTSRIIKNLKFLETMQIAHFNVCVAYDIVI